MGLSGYTGLPVTLNGISGRKWVNYILLLLIIILFIYFLSGLWASFVHPEPKGPWLFGFPRCPPGGGHELWQQCGCRLLESPGRKNTVQRLEVKHVLFKYIRETHFELQFFSFYNSPIVFFIQNIRKCFFPSFTHRSLCSRGGWALWARCGGVQLCVQAGGKQTGASWTGLGLHPQHHPVGLLWGLSFNSRLPNYLYCSCFGFGFVFLFIKCLIVEK